MAPRHLEQQPGFFTVTSCAPKPSVNACKIPSVEKRDEHSPGPDRAAIEAHLAELLATPAMANASQLARLLKYIVEVTIEGRGAELREYILGVAVFNRGIHFDPKTDTIVRVQARKLRAKLEEHYAANRGPIRIRLVPGRYQPEFEHAPEPSHEVTLAVLPFSGWKSGNAEAGPLTDSFTEEVIHAVSRTPAIRVAVTTSSFATRKIESDARQIGRRLGVRHLVSGSIRWESGTVTVLAQLADAETGFQEWSGRWNRPESATFQLPEAIAHELASALGCEPRAGGPRAPDPAALDLFLRGRHYWNQRTEHGFHRALEHFRQALDIDPGMSRGWAAMSETYLLLAMHGIEPPGEMLEKAKAAAEHGLEFDADSAACHGALGAVSLLLDHDYTKAGLRWRKAVALDPNYSYAWHTYGAFFLASQRRWDEALAALERAERIDPLSASVASDVGIVLYWSGDLVRAIGQCEVVIDAHPWFYRTYIVLARCHAAAGDWTRAIEVVKTSLPLFKGRAFHTYHLATLGYCQARMGNRRGARAVLSEIEALAAKHYCSKLDPALICHGLRDRDRTAHLIQEAEQDRDPWAFLRRVDPLWGAD